MPVMGGLDATRAIREAERNSKLRTPIYALSAAALREEQERGMRAGLDGYLTKPLKQAALKDLLAGINPSMDAAPPSSPGFDYAEGLRRSDEDIITIIGETFLEQMPFDLARLKESLTADDWYALERAAHTIKGNVSNFGATALEQLAEELEEKARQGGLDKAVLVSMVGFVSNEMEKLAVVLKEYLQGSPRVCASAPIPSE